MVEAGPFSFERADAIDEEHVQEGFEVQRRAEALDEGDGAGAHAQSGAADEGGGDRPVDDVQDAGPAAVPRPTSPPPVPCR